ncbi:MAG: sialidase family protein, partial [Candidatus Latescibacterota bacterium]|nr:sialidase family protein [Candidatus Latescibacterota bacterium]
MPTPPQILARLDERVRIVIRPDGSLLGLNCSPDAAGTSWEVSSRASRDGGVSWTPAETVLQLDPALGGWGGCQPVASDDCEIHVLLMCDAGTGVFGLPGQPREPKPLLERHLDVSHARTNERGSRWREPVRIWQGHTGSINSAIQMQNGRLVLPFAQLTNRTWRARGGGLDAFWFAGTSETIVLTSDDGEAWRI